MPGEASGGNGRRGGWLRAFGDAWRGVAWMVRSQRNAKFHLVATAGVITLGLVQNVRAGEWLALVLATGLVWAAEALNTAVELLADRVCAGDDERIGRLKDVAAGAVLLAAVAAAVVAGIVFL